MMKKAFLLTVTALAALLATSCQKDDLGRILTATIEQYEHNGGAKAYINNDNYACWENGDKVKINGIEYPISIPSGEGQPGTASIDGTEGLTERPLLAYYPASGVSSWSDDNVTISLPQVQTYRENNGHQIIDNPMAAYCPEGSNELKFRNLAALLKVTITAPAGESLGVKAILVKGDDDQMLWGTAQLTLNNQNQPILDKISGGSASVFLVFENPMVIGAGNSKSFYIVVPAASTFFDFTIHVADFNDGIYKKVSKLGQSLQRNYIGALTYAPADNEKVDNVILYAGSIDDFDDVHVISNADGVLLFDGPLTTIGRFAFQPYNSLTHIYLPASLTSIGNNVFSNCSSLTAVYVNRWVADGDPNITPFGSDMFEYCEALMHIYVPSAAVDTYKDADGWSNYANKIEAMPEQ